MAINIFKHEFRATLKSVVTWSAALAVLTAVFMALFPAFSEQAALINEAMSKFPPALLTAFGMSGVDMSTVLGFFGFIFLFIQICLAIQASNYGFGLVSVEEREWTADFLLTKPVRRTHVLNAKLAAALLGLLITDIVTWAACFGFVAAFSAGKPYDSGALALLMAAVVPFQLFFFAVGLAVSLLVKRIRSVMPYSMGLAFGMYVLNVFGSLLGSSVLEKITPFRHFEPNFIAANGRFDLPLALVSVAVIVVSAAGSYVLYNRRDIPSVS